MVVLLLEVVLLPAEEGEGVLDAPRPQRDRLRLARKEDREDVDPLTILPVEPLPLLTPVLPPLPPPTALEEGGMGTDTALRRPGGVSRAS